MFFTRSIDVCYYIIAGAGTPHYIAVDRRYIAKKALEQPIEGGRYAPDKNKNNK